jgi:hypothetical protein
MQKGARYMKELMQNTNDNNTPYCDFSEERYYKKKQLFLENGYKNYLKNACWDFNFEHEASVADYEQSFLSQMIWGHLLIKNNENSSFCVNRNYMYVKGETKDKILLFHFDVMNNPKTEHSLGKKACEHGCNEKRKQWEKIYHTIGNFAPIPWAENLQRKHNNLGERWDCLLRYCKYNWTSWNKKDIHSIFEEYMKSTY